MKDRLVCSCVGVHYSHIRAVQAQKNIFSVPKIKNETKAGTVCCTCIPDLESIVNRVCDCRKITLKEVKNAIKGGAKTVSEVQKETGAGTLCATCVPLIEALLKK